MTITGGDFEARLERAKANFDPIEASSTVLTPKTVGERAKGMVETSGEVFRFFLAAVRAIPMLRKYPAELFRQGASLIVGSSLIVIALVFLGGLSCGTEVTNVTNQIGAPGLVGFPAALCTLRIGAPLTWGYILAAKVGCGLVAEIGSMRISEEIDAMEVMGVPSMTYVVASRMVAALLLGPFLFFVSISMSFLASYLVIIKQLEATSVGGYLKLFWASQTPLDHIYVLVVVGAMTVITIVVGCYFGYTAKGGPVGVGYATAKSMVVNLIQLHLVWMVGTQLFWGISPRISFAN